MLCLVTKFVCSHIDKFLAPFQTPCQLLKPAACAAAGHLGAVSRNTFGKVSSFTVLIAE